MLSFDEQGLRNALSKEPPQRQLAFALAICGRLIPYYVEYCRLANLSPDPRPQQYLTYLWRIALGMESAEPRHLLEAKESNLLAIMPGEDDPWNERHPQAEDAMAALAYSIRNLMVGNPQDAVFAARRCYESADQFAIHDLNCDFSDPESERKLLMHEVVQRELARQDRDLRLASAGKLAELKALSESEALLAAML